MTVEATLCEIISEGRLLLQRKATGRFGEGKWNGPGGKLGPGEAVMVGNTVSTDVFGGNRVSMRTVLVQPGEEYRWRSGRRRTTPWAP